MADQRIQYTEEMVGAAHPSKADTLNRLGIVEHNNDGTHKGAAVASLLALGLRPLTGFDGITLRTDPDKDSADTKVKMYPGESAQAILSNGERASLSSVLTFDIEAAAGIGGLMAGDTEAASRWYEVHLCKGSAGQGLLGREAKRYFEDEAQLASNGEAPLQDAAARTELAQGFQTTNSGEIDFVDLMLVRRGSPASGRIWVEIQADSAGSPTRTPLAASDKITLDNISRTNQWIRIPFRSPFSVSAGAQYHLVLRTDTAQNANNSVEWRVQNTAPYGRGTLKAWDGVSTWGDQGKDAAFKIYVTILQGRSRSPRDTPTARRFLDMSTTTLAATSPRSFKTGERFRRCRAEAAGIQGRRRARASLNWWMRPRGFLPFP